MRLFRIAVHNIFIKFPFDFYLKWRIVFADSPFLMRAPKDEKAMTAAKKISNKREELLNMDVREFFSIKRFDALDIRKNVSVRARNAVILHLCKNNLNTRRQDPISLKTMREFLALYKTGKPLALARGAGVAVVDAIILAIKEAGLRFDED